MLSNILKNSQKILTYSSYLTFGIVKFPLPDLGQKIKQGTVKKLYVKQGDKVEQFQKIADVESDKQFTQITAPQVGKISRIHYKQKQVCKVGDLFMEIQVQGKAHDNFVINQNKQSKQPQAIKQNSNNIKTQKIQKEQKGQSKKQSKDDYDSDQSVLASPVVRMFAKINKIFLDKVQGTGKKGRILKQDLMNYMQGKNIKQSKQSSKKSISTPPIKTSQEQTTRKYQSKKIQMNPFQKGMQKTMTEANKISHLYYDQKMDVTQLDSMREKLKASGMKVTIMGILIKTFSLAILQHPKINSTYRSDKSQYQFETHESHNISLAIDTANGLVVPNIKRVQQLSILDIQSKLSEMKKLADSAKLTRQHLQGGTICLSNIGTIAGISANPLILYPQICIVAIGKVVQAPYFFGEHYSKRKYMTMSYGCDHRIIDGASVAKFSNQWKKILENPYITMAKMR